MPMIQKVFAGCGMSSDEYWHVAVRWAGLQNQGLGHRAMYWEHIPKIGARLCGSVIRRGVDSGWALETSLIEFLDMGIADKGAADFAEAMLSPKCPRLMTVSMGENQIGDAGAKAIANGFPRSNIWILHLEHNRISDGAKTWLREKWVGAGKKPPTGLTVRGLFV